MAEGLQLEIGAKVDGLKKGLADSEKALNQFRKKATGLQADLKDVGIQSARLEAAQEKLDKEFKSGAISLAKYDTQTENVSRELKILSGVSQRLKGDLSKTNQQLSNLGGKSMTSVKRGAANAVPATQEFSRIIQDMPFGIQGVANNITQLTAQFGYLSKNAGGTSAALKAMLGTLTGPAGILLIVSAVTSLMVSFGDKLKFATSQSKELAKATSEFLTEAKAEVSTLETLLRIARDESNTKTQRLGAIKELNDKYSEYLGNLDLESVATDKVTRSVKALSASLIQKAKIQGLEKLIAKKTEERTFGLNKAENERIVALDKLKAVLPGVIQGNALLRESLGDLDPLQQVAGFEKLLQRTDVYGKAAKQAGASVAGLRKDFFDASREVDRVNGLIDDSISSLVRLQEKYKKGLFEEEGGIAKVGFDQEEIVLKAGVDKAATSVKLRSDLKTIEEQMQPFRIKAKLFIETGQKQIGAVADNFGIDVGAITASIPPAIAAIQSGGDLLANELLNLNQKVAGLATQGLQSALSNVGDAIGSALASGANVAGAIGSALLQSFGQFLSQMGDLLIEYGLFAKAKGALDTAIAAGGPVAIGAGIAAVAVGVALKAAGAAIGSRASSGLAGGGVGGSGSSSGGNNFGTSTSTQSSGFNGGRVVFEIGGDKLIGVLNNTSLGNLRVGDSNQLITTG